MKRRKRILTPEQVEKYREYRRNWYYRNKESSRERIKERRQEIKRWFQDLKNDLSCKICGETFNRCLEFHHKEPELKVKEVSIMVAEGYSKEKIEEEINKCEVLCSNCHRKAHADYVSVV